MKILRKHMQSVVRLVTALAVARSLNNIAYCFLGINQLDSARHYAERGREASRRYERPYLEGFALRTLGDVDFNEKNYESALDKYEASDPNGRQA